MISKSQLIEGPKNSQSQRNTTRDPVKTNTVQKRKPKQ